MDHNSNPPAPDTVTAEFKIKNAVLTLTLPRAELVKRRELSECVVSFGLIAPIRHEGRDWRFVVFPIKITPELKLEQTGEGILCSDEAEATDTRNEILKSKNQKPPPVVLASWNGGFTLGTITKERKWRREFELLTFRVPELDSGKQCGFALRIYGRYLDEPRKLISEELLPVIDKQAAEELVRQKMAKARAGVEEKIKLQNDPQIEPALIQSQLKVLAKSYPETVAFLKSPNPANAGAAYAAYQRETFAITGRHDGTLSKDEFVKTAKALINASRRKHSGIDMVEFQIVAGWRSRGYDQMTPKQRFEDLKNRGFQPASSEAVRKMCERLKLPTIRKRGAPRKTPSNK
jgi:hypothetical protein